MRPFLFNFRWADLSSEKGELKAESPPCFGFEIAGVIPPFGTVSGVRGVISRELKVAWSGYGAVTLLGTNRFQWGLAEGEQDTRQYQAC